MNDKYLTHHCEITNYYIQYRLDSDTAIMDTIFVDYVNLNIRALFNLFRCSINELTKRGFKKLRQSVSFEDYETCIKGHTTWRIMAVHHQNTSYVIECDLADAYTNFRVSHGLPKDHNSVTHQK